MTEWTNPPPPEPVDTYRTPGEQADPPCPRRCFDCKHARWTDDKRPDEDGITAGLVMSYPKSLKCSFNEPMTEARLCPLTGETIESEPARPKQRPECIAKNESADCADFSTRHKPKPATVPVFDIGEAVALAQHRRGVPWVPISLGACVTFGLLVLLFS